MILFSFINEPDLLHNLFILLDMSSSAACGSSHTITLSNDKDLYSFGKNDCGQLGLGHNYNVSIPSCIPNLPKIKQVSCGGFFTFCVDEEGFLWSFGESSNGKLGENLNSNLNIPKKIKDIPPVVAVSCGYEHTLIITNDSDLWSCGNNSFGQLCREKKIDEGKLEATFQKTSFSNISKISSGVRHSLFQNDKGEIFSCGNNDNGELGLGHCNSPQFAPILIPDLLSNIVQFVCGSCHNLFLDSEGTVLSVGYNIYGQLGLGHNENQNVLNQIPNIPPIQSISCVASSSYLIDLEGNVWSFGYNGTGQLGHGDKNERNLPTKIESLENIQQLSCGSYGTHFLAKDSQNRIFVSGYNGYGQLGTGNTKPEHVLFPKELNSEYFSIWEEVIKSKAKSARK